MGMTMSLRATAPILPTKGKKEHARDASWEHAERESSRFLVTHDGKDESTQYRFLQSSLGRVGEHSALGFDSVSIHYCGEAKQRSKVAAWIVDGWRQLCGLAIVHKKSPVLFLWIKGADPYITVEGKKHRMPNPLHCLDAKRHASLLHKEKIADGVDDVLHDAYQQIRDFLEHNAYASQNGEILAADLEGLLRPLVEKTIEEDVNE